MSQDARFAPDDESTNLTPDAQPSDNELEAEVAEAVHEYLGRARNHLGRRIEAPEIQFDLKGKTAGKADRNGLWIRYNRDLLRENPATFLQQTVPHEVAHIAVHQVFGERAQPHGPEWRDLMRAFGLEPKRCHDFDTSNAAQRTAAKHPLVCDCRTHHVTPKLVAQVVEAPKSRWCKVCKGYLAPADAATRKVGEQYRKSGKEGGKKGGKAGGSQRQRRFTYACPGCGGRLVVTTTRHNRIQGQEATYQTKCCRRKLTPGTFTGEQF